MIRARTPAVLLALGAAWSSAPPEARPDERERITVVAGSDVPRTWVWELRAALRRTRRVVPVELGPATGPVAPSSAREELSAAAAEAERRFRQADFEGCVATTSEAERRLALPLAEQGLLRELSGLASIAAACEIKRGATQVAMDRASLALALDPDLVIDPARNPPDVADLFAEAHRARASASTVHLELDAGLPDARFFVDGRDAGRSVDLPPGPHYVAARARGTRLTSRPIAVTGPDRIVMELEPLAAEAARLEIGAVPRSAALDAPLARAVALASGASRVLTVAVEPRGQIVLVLRGVDGLAVTELGNARARAPGEPAGWSGLLGALHASLRPAPPPRRPPSASGGTFWLWAAGAAAVVAAGTAITLALVADEPVVDNYELRPGGACIFGACCPWPCKQP
ncbi:MAG: hypothetical protein HYY06_27900 [Deltaproteobacteria bacterium]|nr:hypothetical protein [Deltaproteobacteria bacterium]